MSRPPFDLTPRAGLIWRFVEAQHKISTVKLVDTLDEQRLLEELLDATKPPVPADCAHLHWLLFTPFRYPARHATRFRAAGDARGVFYAAERVETAAAEMAFYRLLFFLESPGLEPPRGASEFTAFSARYKTDVLDLSTEDWCAEPGILAPADYATCISIAQSARALGAGAIRYRSVRDPGQGANLALLDCAAFAAPAPVETQSWHFRVSRARVLAIGPGVALEFAASDWDDPRLN